MKTGRIKHTGEKLYCAGLDDLDSHLLQEFGEVGRVGVDNDLLPALCLK